ncbi:TadE/TadG family type IV pilus assembly protein [Salinibacillus xinjiangensis]|nr:TadE/TadG family type IV pilus assembly protein [Salinibacillus xinjiangensis]
MMKSERGQAAVELALTLPILLLLIFGMIDFGRIFHAYLTLEHTSRESARVASVGATNTDIIDYAYQAASGLNSEELIVHISPETNRTRGTYVTVTTSYPVELFTPFLDQIMPNPFTVTGETVMRVE